MAAPREDPFPAPSKQASGTIDGIATEAAAVRFADKILLTISQDGRLSQWIQVPLSAPSGATVDMQSMRGGLLPATHLTPRMLLGGASEERATLGQLFAAQVASLLARRDPEERRTLMLGLGLRSSSAERNMYFDFLELVEKVL